MADYQHRSELIAKSQFKMYPGMVILWYGPVVDIPNGWLLCDGTNGTPNLRDRFLVGSGNTYAQNDSDGNVSHEHSFNTFPHVHEFAVGTGLAYNDEPYERISSSEIDSGITDPENNLPLYHALCYLMKQ